MDLNQISRSLATDPNGEVIPMNQDLPALFVSATDKSFWDWDSLNRAWEKLFPVASQLLQGTSDPSLPPPDASKPAYHTNLTTGVLKTWNVTGQFWQ